MTVGKFSDVYNFKYETAKASTHLMKGDGTVDGKKDGKITAPENTNGFIESLSQLTEALDKTLDFQEPIKTKEQMAKSEQSKDLLTGTKAAETLQESALSNALYFDETAFGKICNLASNGTESERTTYDQADLKVLAGLDKNPGDISKEDFRVLLGIPKSESESKPGS